MIIEEQCEQIRTWYIATDTRSMVEIGQKRFVFVQKHSKTLKNVLRNFVVSVSLENSNYVLCENLRSKPTINNITNVVLLILFSFPLYKYRSPVWSNQLTQPHLSETGDATDVFYYHQIFNVIIFGYRPFFR